MHEERWCRLHEEEVHLRGVTLSSAPPWWTTFTWIMERRLVDQTGARWNQLAKWLRQLDVVRVGLT